MLFQVVSKFGENLIQNRYTDRLGFIEVGVSVRFVIDENGNFLRAEKVNAKLEEKVWIPISVYEESFSDAEEKRREYSHSLFEHLYIQKDEHVKVAYYEKLRNLVAYVNCEKLSAIMEFITKNDLCSLAEQVGVTKEQSYFCVVIERNGEIYEVWKDKDITCQIRNWLINECSKGSTERDIYGRKTGIQINKHSRVLGEKAIRARIVSQRIYNRFYGGNPDDNANACVIGSLSEIMFNHGINIIKNTGYMYEGLVMYLGDLQSPFTIPFNWTVRGFCEFFGRISDKKTEWEQLRNTLIKQAENITLFWVAFDNVNKGRISTYKTYMFNEVESQNIMHNIFNWIEKTTIFINEAPVFSFHSYIYKEYILREKELCKIKSMVFLLYESIIYWEIGRLWEAFFPKAISKAIHEKDVRGLREIIRISRQLLERNEGGMNIWKDDMLILSNNLSVSYVAGLYLACIHLLEKKMDYVHGINSKHMSMAECRSEFFRLHPLQEMIRLREIMAIRMKRERVTDRGKYSMLLDKMAWLEEELENSVFPRKLDGEMYMAFDIAIYQYRTEYMTLKKKDRLGEEEDGI